MDDLTDRLVIGHICSSHGIKGFLKVRSLSGEASHFLLLKTVFIRKGERFLSFEVEAVRKTTPAILLKLVGIDSPEEAVQVRGLDIWVERKNAAPLKKGEYYHADLCRCQVIRRNEIIGTVRAVCDGGSADILEVVRPQEKPIMVPFRDHFVREVDVEKRVIVLDEEFPLP